MQRFRVSSPCPPQPMAVAKRKQRDMAPPTGKSMAGLNPQPDTSIARHPRQASHARAARRRTHCPIKPAQAVNIDATFVACAPTAALFRPLALIPRPAHRRVISTTGVASFPTIPSCWRFIPPMPPPAPPSHWRPKIAAATLGPPRKCGNGSWRGQVDLALLSGGRSPRRLSLL